ncbi:MAG: tetratricopeptide repeat protein [Rhizobiaceae bacterium]
MLRRLCVLATLTALATPAVPATVEQPAGSVDPSRFGEIKPSNPPVSAQQPGGVDPARFGDPSTPKDAIGKPPVTILKSKEITPDAPVAPAVEDGVDPKRFGGKVADAAYGAFQRGLYKTAYNLALPRAEQGDSAAQTLIAELLTRGLGVPADQEAAAKWYAKAAENGVPAAQFQYALMQADGKFVKKDGAGAMELMKAAADAGNTLAQFNLAQMYVQDDRGPSGFSKALPYYEKAAATGLPDAQYAMAQIFASGAAGKKQDLAEARRHLLLAAKQGFDTAQLELGTWMVEGRGGERDAKGGFVWLRQAAEGGNVAAMNRLAKLYMNGIGTDPNPIDAAAWYFLARRAGLNDFEMADFLDGLTAEQTKAALERANRLR